MQQGVGFVWIGLRPQVAALEEFVDTVEKALGALPGVDAGHSARHSRHGARVRETAV